MSKKEGLKALLKFADSLVSGGEKLYEQFNGKSRSEAMEFLKGNLAALKSAETRANLQKTLQSQDPMKLAQFLGNAHKNLSAEDAIKLAEILTSDNPDQKLPEYLEKKIKNPKPNRLPSFRKRGGKRGPGKK